MRKFTKEELRQFKIDLKQYPIDVKKQLAKRVIELKDYQKEIQEYIERKT